MKMASAITVQGSDSLSKALSLLTENGVGVLVFDKKKYLGMIDERGIRSSSGDASAAHCKNVAIHTPVLSPSTPTLEVCKAFFSGRFKTLPVMEGEKLMGVVTRWEVLNALRDEGHLVGQTVGAHMASPILTIDQHAPLSVADATMQRSNVRRLAVLNNGQLVGLISVHDLLKAKAGPKQRRPQMRQGTNGMNTLVSSFMRDNVETISPQASLFDAVEHMLDASVAALIVTEGKRPVGIITAKDIFESILFHQEGTLVQVSGLHDEEKSAAEDVVEAGQAMLEKVGKGIGAESLTLHIKKTGGEYFVSAHVHGDVRLLASASDYDLMGAITAVLEELKTQALRHKRTGMEGRKIRR